MYVQLSVYSDPLVVVKLTLVEEVGPRASKDSVETCFSPSFFGKLSKCVVSEMISGFASFDLKKMKSYGNVTWPSFFFYASLQ